MKSFTAENAVFILRRYHVTAIVLFHCIPPSSTPCAIAEYEVDGECCPMCSPGQYVSKHCTEYSSTSCVECPVSTFIDKPSGRNNCMLCAICDSRNGLRIKEECISISDTICEPLEGNYCIEKIEHTCKHAVEHSKCKPGQYITQRGTAATDTVCGDCVGETYSDGSFTSCQPHTQCQLKGLKEIRPGTNSSDAECEERSTVPFKLALSAGIVVFLLGVGAGILIYFKITRKFPILEFIALRTSGGPG
ncbi:tumor necrosis factor receptor superfamily member 14-like [Chanos chanos]|uniref:Tumor necrosis factor receptor superfamily member 14-like n=1 Tax=Chanos chanos TaxID=29144 RepID=A0A6J2W6N2_CHACN|nr:tumor necrosis factor receptor superfamily member 14-like [Chanos chanos]